jgi:hypothetical protein
MRSCFLFSSLSSEPTGSALFAFFSRVIGVPVMGSAPFALLPRVVRAPVLGRAYSTAPTLFHAASTKFYGNYRAKVPNILREEANYSASPMPNDSAQFSPCSLFARSTSEGQEID